MKLNDAVIGAVLLVFAVTLMIHVSIGWSWLVTTDFSGFPRAAPGKPGPALFPFSLGILFFISGAILLARGLRARGALLEWQEWTRRPGSKANAIAVVVVVLAYQFLSEWIGFLPVAVVGLFLLMRLLRVRATVALVVSVACALFIHTLFVKFLLVPLPWGLLEPIAW
jgi:putative tricarboxylic transport membrane protein